MRTRTRILILLAAVLFLAAVLACGGPGMVSNDALMDDIRSAESNPMGYEPEIGDARPNLPEQTLP